MLLFRLNPHGSDPNDLDQMLNAPEIVSVSGVAGKLGGGDQQVHRSRAPGLTTGRHDRGVSVQHQANITSRTARATSPL